jgi:precorrin-2 dehydrogenase / sirohydrochlorin ferrochelatase
MDVLEYNNEGNVLFPVFFKLHELEVLVVGGGYVGLEKLQALVKNSPETHITLIAKEILQKDIFTIAEHFPHIKIKERRFKRKDLRDKDLVFLATNNRKLHEKIKKITRRKHIMTNVADTPDLCDFYLSSVVKKGDLKIAISSNGKSPTLTKRIREYLEEAIPDDVQALLDNLKDVRDQLKGDFEYKVKKLNEVTSEWLNKGKKDEHPG